MRYALTAGAVLAATIRGVATQACAAGSAQEINGNWYCQAVQAISYTNFGTPGSYDKVTYMEDGVCTSTPQNYSGGISPLDDEVSWHFRGPLVLKQFAFYAPGSSANQKREAQPSPHERRHHHHGHEHFHEHNQEIREIPVKRQAPWVTAVINGQTVSWANQYTAAPTQAPVAVATASLPAASAWPTWNAGLGNWGRQAYYNAQDQVADGLVFLNHNGGQGSGVWDTTWGNSLSYASADGTTAAPSPVIFGNEMLGDNLEIVVMSDKLCANDCGTVRPGGVSYHGFGGPSKVFLLEFSMPATGKTGWDEDMPAAWILNAQIPRTMQYGPASCSCWESGCGEWDIFEILDSGNFRAKSTFHGNPSGGDSNYFQRPTANTIKAAVVFDGVAGAGHIVILPDDTIFNTTLSDSIISGYMNTITTPDLIANFKLTPSF